MYIRFIILMFALFICALPGRAQTELCKEKLIRSFTYMKNLYADSTHLYMHYKVKTMQASDKSIQGDEMKVYMSDSIYVVTSSMTSYYSDNKDAFMIMPVQNKMYRLDVQAVKNKSKEQTSLFRKEMLDSSKILSCTSLENQSEKISMKPPASFTKYTHISKVDYVLDATNGFIKECTVYYAEGNALIYTQYSFISISSTVVVPFIGGVKEMFLSSDNLPVSLYAGYRYTDLRQKK